MKRQFVHLAADLDTSNAVGRRRGAPVTFEVDSRAMREEGIPFYLSENGVWLVDQVEPRFLRRRP